MNFAFTSKCYFSYLLKRDTLNNFILIENGFLLKALLYDYDHLVAH